MAKTRVFGIRLDARQAWAWQRMGNHAIRGLIAPEGLCVQCGDRRAQAHSRNGWFCFPCQDHLDQLSLLPPSRVDQLEKHNQQLLTQIKRLRSQLETRQGDSPHQDAQQLSLFDD